MSTSINNNLERIISLSNKIVEELNNELENFSDIEAKEENSKLVSLNIERDTLIQETFNEQQSSNYEQHLPLINQVVALDSQLLALAEKSKLALKNGLLKMKKNQKAADTYKKY